MRGLATENLLKTLEDSDNEMKYPDNDLKCWNFATVIMYLNVNLSIQIIKKKNSHFSYANL